MNLTKSFNFWGIEESFEQMIDRSIKERSTEPYHYLEIGIATGATLKAVADHLKERIPPYPWRTTGIDLLDGPYFNCRTFIKSAMDHQVTVEHNCRGRKIGQNDIRIALLTSAESKQYFDSNSISFCLIDGCHSASAVERDFLLIEQAICRNGIVAFHDASLEDQGGPHEIEVGQALGKLHLKNSINMFKGETLSMVCTRPGWSWIGSANGDKSPGNIEQNGNGIAFFQRI